MKKAADLSEVVYEWMSARALRLSCARTLAGFSCEYAERADPETGDDGTPRCYLSGGDEADWCGACQQRNRLYPGLKPLRAAERRTFNRLQRMAMRVKREHDTNRTASSKEKEGA